MQPTKLNLLTLTIAMSLKLTAEETVLDICVLGQTYICGTVSGCLEVFNPAAQRVLPPQQVHSLAIRSLCATPTHIYSAGADKSVVKVDVSHDCKQVWRQEDAHKHKLTKVVHKEELLVSGDEDGAVRVWDARVNVCLWWRSVTL